MTVAMMLPTSLPLIQFSPIPVASAGKLGYELKRFGTAFAEGSFFLEIQERFDRDSRSLTMESGFSRGHWFFNQTSETVLSPEITHVAAPNEI